MRLASWRCGNEDYYGAVTDQGLLPLSPETPEWPSLREVIAGDGLPGLEEAARRSETTSARLQDPEKCVFSIPVPAPEKIICIGVNYPDRNAEYRDGREPPPFPSMFIRFARSFVGHDVPLTRPAVSEQFDYEGEIVLVIGKGGRSIPTSRALDHIAGLTLCNEGSIRDWMRHAKFNVTQGKNFDGTGSIGPWIIPFADESQIADIRLTTRVNGELRQDDRTGRMVFPPRFLIHYVSTFTTLVPGDLIITGTPTGAGARSDPPKWLIPGDIVEVEAEGIGRLRNRIRDPEPDKPAREFPS
ncbi:MAG: fumarylacetoacetate hydrolase family protein [Paracoccaceae bacterium]|nr:fumarylacetoacetate hydrolase family protein [Paracoccaceae bacterium]MDE2914630.1 fumarylacetoacetate hydrolase family protein [Paracoccaceae bacterium]